MITALPRYEEELPNQKKLNSKLEASLNFLLSSNVKNIESIQYIAKHARDLNLELWETFSDLQHNFYFYKNERMYYYLYQQIESECNKAEQTWDSAHTYVQGMKTSMGPRMNHSACNVFREAPDYSYNRFYHHWWECEPKLYGGVCTPSLSATRIMHAAEWIFILK